MPHIQSLTLLYDSFPTKEKYPFNLPVLNETESLAFTTPVTMFVGENGTGKSTLLEALARVCGVHIWEYENSDRRVEYNEFEDKLYRYLKISRTNGAAPGSYYCSEKFKDFKKMLDGWAASDRGQLDPFGGESLMTKSHGQSMMAYFHARYRIKGVYFLDEPETGLSPTSQLELLDILDVNSRAGHAQFFIATHSPILLSCPHARIISFDHVPAKTIPYEETGHYRIYKRLFSDAR